MENRLWSAFCGNTCSLSMKREQGILILFLLSGLLFSCHKKVAEASAVPPLRQAGDIQSVDSLLNREQSVALGEGKLYNVDLVHGYHMIKLGMRMGKLNFNGAWRKEVMCNAVISFSNDKKTRLVFINNKLEYLQVASPELYNDVSDSSISIYKILCLKFGPPNASNFLKDSLYGISPDSSRKRFTPDVLYRNAPMAIGSSDNKKEDRIVSAAAQGHLQQAVWKTDSITMTYYYLVDVFSATAAFGKKYLDSNKTSLLQIKTNQFDLLINTACQRFSQDSIANAVNREKFEQTNDQKKILNSN